MVKKLYFLVVLLFLNISLFAQSKIQILSNHSFHTTIGTNDFHDIQILNSGSTCRVLVEILVKNNLTYELIQRQDIEVDLLPGINSLSNLTFIVFNYSDELSEILRMGNEISYGKIEICTSVRVKSEEIEYRECDEVNLSRIEMITLLMPGNGEVIETLNPDLEWFSTFTGDINYQILLSEVAPYSNVENAIVSNPKLLNYSHQSMLLPYPFDAVPLRYNITYCWQVFAFDKNGQKVGQSEIWKFTPKTEIEIDEPSKGFTLIHRNVNRGNYLYNNTIRFLYDNRTKDQKMNYSIIDLKTGKSLESLPEISLVYGLNKIILPTEGIKQLEKKGNYSLIIRNSLNEKYTMNFNLAGKN